LTYDSIIFAFIYILYYSIDPLMDAIDIAFIGSGSSGVDAMMA